MHYDLTPEQLADYHHRFVTELGVSAIGGCCGTTPAHLRGGGRALRRTHGRARASRCSSPRRRPSTPSVPFRQDTSFLVVGERTNANGSRQFREAMLDGDWDTCVAMARDQVKEGSHLIDVCVDYTGADGVADMTEVASRFATQSSVPLMIDTTEGPVAEAALQWLGGRAVLNSVNLEDGDGAGHPARHLPAPGPQVRRGRRVHLHRRGGPGPHRRLEAAGGAGHPRRRRRPLRPRPRGPDLRPAGPAALDRHGGEPARRHRDARGDRPDQGRAARGLHHPRPVERLVRPQPGRPPGAQLGLPARVRRGRPRRGDRARLEDPPAHPDRRAGPGGLPRPHLRPARARATTRCRSCCRSSRGPRSPSGPPEEHLDWPVERRLEQRIVDGNRNGLEADLDEALASGLGALEIVNEFLLAGMQTVGELFASGEMQLPFVLGSAETMKMAVAYLEPHMERADQGGKGTIVLATVKGDVHDIGKNLVDIIFTNNGYEVVNLGIKVGIAEMIAAVEEHQADALGMSGLLVKSTLIMRENLEELNEPAPVERAPGAARRGRPHPHLRRARPARGLRRPPLLRQGRLRGAAHDGPPGGAAARRDRRPGLRPRDLRVAGAAPQRAARARARRPTACPPARPRSPPTTRSSSRPFVGSRVAKGIPLDDIAEYLNLTALFRNQWGFRPDKDTGENDADFKERVRAVLREQLAKAKEADLLVPQVAWGHFAGQRRRRRPRRLQGRRRAGPSGCASPSPARPRSPGSASPTSSARPTRASPTGPASSWSRWGAGSPRRRRGCSPPTSTSSTCSCTASGSRWPRRWPSTGTAASARSWASPTRTARR